MAAQAKLSINVRIKFRTAEFSSRPIRVTLAAFVLAYFEIRTRVVEIVVPQCIVKFRYTEFCPISIDAAF